jgi:hypothetical protein
MIWSLSETLEFIEPHVSGNLVSPTAYSHIKTIANALPDAMSSYYIECRLGPNKTQVDFLMCTTVSDGGREVLAGNNETKRLGDAPVENLLWCRIYDFFKHWAKPASPLYNQVPMIWLEFDNVNEPPPKMPLPCVMFCVDPEYLEGPRQSSSTGHFNPQKCKSVTQIGCELLLGHALSPQSKQNLFACFDLLPVGGYLIHISVMLPRKPVVLKVYASVPKNQLLKYLTRIGWTGSTADIETILTTFCSSINEVKIDLTVGETIAPKIGIVFSEVPINTPGQNDAGYQNLLDLCVENGLCTAEKRDSLIDWPGFSRNLFTNYTWPTRFSRWVDIKIVYQPEHPLEAKGYLGFMPYFSFF